MTKKKVKKKLKRTADGRFAKGNKGGNGRPKKINCIPDILNTIGEEEINTKNGKLTKMQAIMDKTMELALKGEKWAVQFIAERTNGRVTEKIEMDTTQKIEFVDLSKGKKIKLEDIIVEDE